jgi:CRP-like cAMP-binding protein
VQRGVSATHCSPFGSGTWERIPGTVISERALLEDRRRTATLRAVTNSVIAVAAKDQIKRGSLASLSELHHREDQS